MNIGDPTLNLNPQAWAVLHALAGIQPEFARKGDSENFDVDIVTYAWYSGRERGFTLAMQSRPVPSRDWLFIAVGESRGSDEIAVYHWVAPGVYGSPPEFCLDGDPYGRGIAVERKNFPELQVHRVVKHVYSLLKKAYKAQEGG